jgi:DNA (cytosine-5)-methyltransferase 1
MGLKFFDLFAGIGGFRLGMERAGHECVGSCEWDKHARETYKKNFGSYPEYDDAKDLHPQSLPYFDVLCAGFPCQAFSIAGKRMGFEDTRGTIFFEIARIAKEKRPPYLFLENVKGLLSHDKGRTFDTIISTLDEMGYDAEWQVLNSKYFVPQNRERIFIVGHLRGERTRQVFPLGDYDQQTTKKIKRVGGYSQCSAVYDTDGLSPTISACTHGYAIGNISVKACLTPDREEKRQMGRRFKEDGEPAFTVNTQDRHGVMIDTTMVYMSNTNANMKQRIQERTESWTLGTGTDFGIKEGIRIRRLTPKECERLQGFPDDWTIGSDTQRYKQCGNAVTVDVVEYIAKELRLG